MRGVRIMSIFIVTLVAGILVIAFLAAMTPGNRALPAKQPENSAPAQP